MAKKVTTAVKVAGPANPAVDALPANQKFTHTDYNVLKDAIDVNADELAATTAAATAAGQAAATALSAAQSKASPADIDTKIATALTALINGAPDAYNTFQELAAYVASDQTGAAAMTSAIQANTQALLLRYTKQEVDALLLSVGGGVDTTTPTTLANFLLLQDPIAWGDSLTGGGGGAPGFPKFATDAYGPARTFINKGIGGNTSTQIKDRLLAASAEDKARLTVLWMGHNDAQFPDTVKANIQASVAALGHTRFLLLTILVGGTPGDSAPGGELNERCKVINDWILASYPQNSYDINAFLLTQGDGSAQDNADTAAGIIPASLRSDVIHLSVRGSTLVAEQVTERLFTQFEQPLLQNLRTQDIFQLFGAAPEIGRVTPGIARFIEAYIKKLGIGLPPGVKPQSELVIYADDFRDNYPEFMGITFDVSNISAGVRWVDHEGNVKWKVAVQKGSGNLVAVAGDALHNGPRLVFTPEGHLGIGAPPRAGLAVDVNPDAGSLLASHLYPNVTADERQNGMAAIPIGCHVYQTDGQEGVWVKKSTGWQFAY